MAVDDDRQALRHVRDILTSVGFTPVAGGAGGASPGLPYRMANPRDRCHWGCLRLKCRCCYCYRRMVIIMSALL